MKPNNESSHARRRQVVPSPDHIMVPVTELKALLAKLQQLGAGASGLEEGVYQTTASLENYLSPPKPSFDTASSIHVRPLNGRSSVVVFSLRDETVAVPMAPSEARVLAILAEGDSSEGGLPRHLSIEEIISHFACATGRILNRHHAQEIVSRIRRRLHGFDLESLLDVSSHGYRLRVERPAPPQP